MSQIEVMPLANETVPIAKAVKHNGLLYISGHVGFKPGTHEPISDCIKEQTEETLRQLSAIMAEAGTSVDKLVMVRVYLTDVQRDFKAMNEVFAKWVGSHRPARTTVGAQLAVEGLLVEIDAVVALD